MQYVVKINISDRVLPLYAQVCVCVSLLPEAVLGVVVPAHGLVVLQLLEHHGAGAGGGAALLRLGRAQRALPGLAGR